MFEEQIEWLQSHFDILTLGEVQNRMISGNSGPAVAITFDDGYADNSLTAIPYLINQRIPATYFVSSDFVKSGQAFPHDNQDGNNSTANGLESIRAMHRSGIEIGVHSRSLRDLGGITDPEVLFDELVVARDEMEDLIEGRVKYFAFAQGQGEYSKDKIFRMAKMYGFQGICSAYGGVNSPGSDPFHLHRISGVAELIRIKNWLSLDPKMVLKSKYKVPPLESEVPAISVKTTPEKVKVGV